MNPLSLDYDDPRAPEVDPDMVIRRALRTRRSRRLTAVAAVLVVGLAVLAVNLHFPSGRGLPPLTLAEALEGSSDYGHHRPVSDTVVVDWTEPAWVTVAWMAEGGDACGGSVGLSGDTRGWTYLNCWGPPPPTDGHPLFSMPLFQVGPSNPNLKQLVVGLVRADAAMVRMTFYGQVLNARVHPVVVDGQVSFGVYAAWFTVPLNTTYSGSQIDEVAFDRAGHQLS